MDEDLFTWGTQMGLSDYVIQILMVQGYSCVSELCQLDKRDLDIFFLQPDLLERDECAALKAALASLPASLLAAESEPNDQCSENSSSPFSGHHSATSPMELGHHSSDQVQHFPPGAGGGGVANFTVDRPQSQSDEDIDDSYDPEEFDFIHAALAAAEVMEDLPREYCGPHQTSSIPADTGMGDHSAVAAAPAAAFHTGLGETFRLMLMGKTGSGKSTTGNTILGQELFNTALDFGSVTSECERQVGCNRNKRIEIMDSPGLYDTSKTHEQICTIIVQAVAGMHPGPHAILYVIQAGRFTPEEYNAYRRLKALFDDSISGHTILLFTHGDQLEREGVTLQEKLQAPNTPDNLKEVVRECGQRCLLFNNLAEDKGPQVDTLLQEVQRLVAKNGGRPYSCPKYSKIGEGLEEEVSKRIEAFEKKDLQRQKYVQNLEQKTRDAEKAAESTRQEYEDMERQREREMKEEEKRRRRTEQELQQQLSQQKHKSEKQRQELEQLKKKREQLESERIKMQKKHENQRRHEMKELDKKYKAFERERQKAREEERNRERKRAEEMERLKASVVRKEEPGFLQKAVNFVVNPIKKLFGF